jgi:hypothetical protein
MSDDEPPFSQKMHSPTHDDIVDLGDDHGLNNVVLVKEVKRRYRQYKHVFFNKTHDLLQCTKKRRYHYEKTSWVAPGGCSCPVLPTAIAAKLNMTSDDEWSSDDNEGVREFYDVEGKEYVRAESIRTKVTLKKFDIVKPYVGVIEDGARPLLEANTRIKEENNKKSDGLPSEVQDPFHGDVDLNDFILIDDFDYLDEVQKNLVEEEKCLHCDSSPCVWSIHI